MAHILVAEDEADLRALVTRALTGFGHTVVATADGGAAIDALVRENGRFDLLLTDIKMPIMDGLALALATARDYPAIKILLMTGYADQRERAQGLEAIVHDVLAKPLTLDVLKKAVDAALAAR
jgi:two-component system cell cycle response regulator CpdR